ncbi:MAG: HNH endonuclease [Gammaproteobacteria bacterium]|nr:HNH endonuclease [Gammaproteobacteria bacterium]
MWKWDQGRLEYFQFDELRKMAKFGVKFDLRQADRVTLESAVGLPFLPDDSRYRPWRNYGRVFRIAMLATPKGSKHAEMTVVGSLLAQDGKVTTDEYLHFLARATTDPSPALRSWDHTVGFRYPLLFVLRFLLARATQGQAHTAISEIVGAYRASQFVGDEDDTKFLHLIANPSPVVRSDEDRQANESIKVLAQLSYLTAIQDSITVSLDGDDAQNLFCDLTPIGGSPHADQAKEILRRAELFPAAVAEMNFDYPASTVSNVDEAGFASFPEGTRVRRTHLTTERNQMIRRRFFEENPSPDCDLCGMNTHRSYPWTDRLLEVHHLLPLCSGARTSDDGTVLEDLVANCPSCHRAVHRYYDKWLGARDQLDFADSGEAREAYEEAKFEHLAVT